MNKSTLPQTKETPNQVNLGDLVVDNVTGCNGIAVVISDYLNGCRRICIAPPVLDNGTFNEERWFDESQVKIVSTGFYQSKQGRPTLDPSGLS